MAPKSKGKNNPSPSAPAAAGASGAGGTSGGGTGPCKLTPKNGDGNAFQMPATSMPVSIALSSPDNKTEFLSASVYKASDLNNPIPGQPTALSATSFTLNLPALQGDSYVVIITVGCLPSAQPVWITEACSGATKLDWIATPGNTSGEFALFVV
jgi:hypothetical protein